MIPRCDTSFHCQALYFLSSNWKILLAGQTLSLLLASAGAAQSTLHLECSLSAPTFSMTLIYLGLSSHMVVLIVRNMERTRTTNHHRPLSLDDTNDDGDDGANNKIFSSSNNDVANNNTVDNKETHGPDSSISRSYKDNAEETAPEVDCNSSDEVLETQDSPAEKYQSTFCCGYITLHQPPWWYFLLALLDVEANAITMLAFRYTTLTSVTLFDALAIPSAMMISKSWLRRKYQCMHYLGAVVCLVGVLANVLADYKSDVSKDENDENPTEAKQHYPHKLRGDVCAILGGLLYGLGDVLTEVTVTATGDVIEYLAMMGSFAFLVSLVQSLLLEWENIFAFFGKDDSHSVTCSQQKGWLLLLTFCGVTMLSYAGGSRFLMASEAAFFNLSLLTGDLWSVVFSIMAQHIMPRPLFFGALVFVLSGVVLYEMAPSPAEEKQQMGSAGTLRGKSNSNIARSNSANNGIVVSNQTILPCLMENDPDKDDGIEML
jgi:solute carrier family 35 protein F1/2